MKTRFIAAILTAVAIAVPLAPRIATIHAAPLTTDWTLPATNMPGEEEIVGDTSVAYTLPSPLERAGGFRGLNGRPLPFHVRVYVASLTAGRDTLRLGKPRMVFAAATGDMAQLWTTVGHWLLYSEYPLIDPTAPWTLALLDVRTGHTIVLDTSEREGVRSLAAQAASDGTTVVWQSWTLQHGQAVSVIRSYALNTGKRSLLAQGGSISTWSYDWPGVSGHNVVFEKQALAGHVGGQILVEDLDSGRIRPLTPATSISSEPNISGAIVTWKQGAQYSDGIGVGVYDLRTGAHRSLVAAHTEQPHAVAGRYVAFPSEDRKNNSYDAVRLFDIMTGVTRTVFTRSGNLILAGGHTLGYYMVESDTVNKPSRIRITTLPG